MSNASTSVSMLVPVRDLVTGLIHESSWSYAAADPAAIQVRIELPTRAHTLTLERSLAWEALCGEGVPVGHAQIRLGEGDVHFTLDRRDQPLGVRVSLHCTAEGRGRALSLDADSAAAFLRASEEILPRHFEEVCLADLVEEFLAEL